MSDRRVGVVGNSTFPLDTAVAAQVIDQIRELGPDVTILTRKRPPFDRFVATVCLVLQIRCLTYDAEGGRSNIERDSALIGDCTELLAFFNLDEFEQGASSGTGWLVEKALSAGIPVRAYAAVDGALVFVGSQDGVTA